MEFTLSISDVIALMALMALMALVFSGYATWKTLSFNERQKSLIDSQERLNNLLLEQGENQVRDSQKADLGAKFITLGNSKHRLKIWNMGKATARNVRIEFPEGNDTFINSDVERKFPLEVLEQFQSVELIAAVSYGSKSKHHIKLIWDDESGADNEKSTYPTI
ncbi:hypothetical protein [Thalassospira sp.]|uniref:hypothetical protein n=1 Tax=Thalassospira sp. TaxID=1912094 RepID=UPI0027356416|nr:hypothetical protein [Thalassospira sp.]MDP2700412.1 hypothetical protein [Thalassospira sp.]